MAIPTQDDTKGARDVLHFSCVSAENIKLITVPYHKNIFGKIVYSTPSVEDFSTEDQNYFILLPLIKALKEVKAN